jgi:hypothetical protein
VLRLIHSPTHSLHSTRTLSLSLARSLAQVLLKILFGVVSLDASTSVWISQWNCTAGGDAASATFDASDTGPVGLMRVVSDFLNHCFSVFKISEHTLHIICTAIAKSLPAVRRLFSHVMQRTSATVAAASSGSACNMSASGISGGSSTSCIATRPVAK